MRYLIIHNEYFSMYNKSRVFLILSMQVKSQDEGDSCDLKGFETVPKVECGRDSHKNQVERIGEILDYGADKSYMHPRNC